MITYLYHKRHKQPGLNYFGKTTRDPYSYLGSGVYWRAHINKHGKDIDTVHVWEFTNLDECNKFALTFSTVNNIVESKSWANLKIEDGLMGGDTLSQLSDERLAEIKRGRSDTHKAIWGTRDRTHQANTTAAKWANISKHAKESIYNKISYTLKNKSVEERELINSKRKETEAKQSEEFRANLRKRRAETLSIRPIRTCPHCGLQGKSQNMDRYHFTKCRFIAASLSHPPIPTQ